MKFFWLNDAVTIQSGNPEERHALALLLKCINESRPEEEEIEPINSEDDDSQK